jgi:hypothetical protein
MNQLKLPPFDAKISGHDDKTVIWDPVRNKWVRLTPEEHVRQAFVSYLVHYKGFPLSHIANEQTITLNGMSRRCDSVIYDRCGAPRIIVEYKAPEVSVSPKVFQQISRYNLVLKVDWLIVTNGLTHYCIRMDYSTGSYTFLQDIPAYDSL